MPVLDRRRREDPRREQTETAFLDAAAGLLADGVPFVDLSVSRVADRAERNRSAFYAHFEDRRALLMRLVEPLRADARAAVVPFVDGVDEDDVRTALTGLLAVFRKHGQVVRAVVETAAYDPEIERWWTDLIGEFANANQGRLEQAGMPPAEARPTAIVLTWMTERSCTQQLGPAVPVISDEELIDALTGAWRRALAQSNSPGGSQ